MVKTASLIINIFICASAFVVVHGADESWIPSTVLTPTEQCKKFNAKSLGMCDLVGGSKAHICHNLPCAVPAKPNRFTVSKTTAVDGTVCGPSHVCRNKECTKVSSGKLPKETGSNTDYGCKAN